MLVITLVVLATAIALLATVLHSKAAEAQPIDLTSPRSLGEWLSITAAQARAAGDEELAELIDQRYARWYDAELPF